MPTPDIGTGATISFGSSGFSAHITNVDHSGISRAVVETSHLGTTTARTFVPGDLYDGGTVALEMNFDSNDQPPITSTAETITITFPIKPGGSTGATAQFSGFVQDWSYTVPLEDKMTATATIKVTGAITWTDGT